ncbi:putative receptor-like protein kinase [Apostasia shenzhenica]|uniref:Putative receptor-like protein kinase n=1 Tax=Apostasia shenzhenica TaxID=1088818 RepID=A0A2I0AMC6_9ASPA|nr:putative receptor-like protein kinase [Apostasia shenzhenica]
MPLNASSLYVFPNLFDLMPGRNWEFSSTGDELVMKDRAMEPRLCLRAVAALLASFFFTALAQGPPAATRFTLADNILIDCGAAGGAAATMPDGRVFKTDAQSSPFLAASDQLLASVPSVAGVPSPLYFNARVFRAAATYTFQVSRPGWHWIRLHFFPLPFPDFNLTSAVFSVTTDDFVLLHSFNLDDPSKWLLKEFLINATKDRLSLHFSPMRNSAAFINAIEVVSSPDILVSDSATSLFPVGEVSGLSGYAYLTAYRLNVGGSTITSANDTLGRQWSPDDPYLLSHSTGKSISVEPKIVKYPDGESPLIAPPSVYASAVKMADARVDSPNFNVTWKLDIDSAFGYLVRLHFCDIISKSLNDLYFNVYINGLTAISGLDLSTVTGGQLASAYFKDIVLNASLASDRITVQIGPMNEDTGRIDALLNGVEVFKMSNSVGSLDGEFGVDGSRADDGGGGHNRKVVAAVGFAMMFGAFAGLGAMAVKWYRRPEDWRKRNSFSSWLLPIHTTQSSFTASKTGSGFGSKSGYTFSSTLGLGRYFSLAELLEATKNWDSNAIIGVGGFGNVYLGELDDGTKAAVKRGNPHSEQGITEFQTEIQMLSKLRHRHLVSLIGYCDENSEMILVYEFMANGPFRDHIYGSSLPPLMWKQRLEICIGAARGLHYLHTGTAQGIIHRDVKTTNILLDENFVAKVSDFGLSKDAPGMNQTHVSTAVKGSFGYLDPEYFRRQQLTDKSDVYSFGVVLLETLCARPALDPALPREQVNLAEWAMQWRKKGLIEKIVDPRLLGSINKDSLNKFVEAAEKCLAEHGVDRPSMGDVLWNLEYSLQLQEANPPVGEDGKQAPANEQERNKLGNEFREHEEAGRNDSHSSAAPAVMPAVSDDSGTAAANELFAQLARMQGR